MVFALIINSIMVKKTGNYTNTWQIGRWIEWEKERERERAEGEEEGVEEGER